LDPLGEGARDVQGVLLEGTDAAEGRRPAGVEVEQVLDRGGHPMKHAQIRPGHQCLFGLPSALAGVVEAEIDKGVQAVVSGLDALDEGVNDLHRGQLAPPDPCRQLRRRHVRELVCQRHPGPPPPKAPSSSQGSDTRKP
jgi:hypothetical protein